MTIHREEALYTVSVRQVWEARCVSPISGELIIERDDEVIGARQKIDVRLLKEAEDRGLTLERTIPYTSVLKAGK